MWWVLTIAFLGCVLSLVCLVRSAKLETGRWRVRRNAAGRIVGVADIRIDRRPKDLEGRVVKAGR
jgi:hypothetical protein